MRWWVLGIVGACQPRGTVSTFEIDSAFTASTYDVQVYRHPELPSA